MPTDTKQELAELYKAVSASPTPFDRVQKIAEYVEFVETTPALAAVIDRENDDLAEMQLRTRNARTDEEHDLMLILLHGKVFTCVSEDFTQLTWVKEALVNFKTNEPEDNLSDPEINMVKDLRRMARAKKPRKYAHFSMEDIMASLEKVHRLLKFELSKIPRMPNATLKKDLRFDEQDGTLYVNGIPVEIKCQDRITNEYRILRYIFRSKDLSDDFFYSEIAEGILAREGAVDDRVDVKTTTYTTAFENINKKILAATGIKRLFQANHSKTAGMVRINPLYLPK